ncbi:MAG: DM13 domain-containing protein [Cyclobacteriaceae bacterium]
MRNAHFPIWFAFLLTACVGTDYENDPKDSAIIVEKQNFELMVGESETIEAVYHYNMWRPEPEVQLAWISEDQSIVAVSSSGTITGIAKGQITVTILLAEEDTTSVSVTVVETEAEVARVEVSGDKSTIDISETLQLSARAYTINDIEITDKMVSWSSSDMDVASIDQNGLATGLANGLTEMIATIDGVNSPSYVIMVGNNGKMGTFQGVGSYDAKGSATLTNDNGNLTLTFSNDFETSFALGTFVYLANSTSGTAVRSQGLEIAEVTTNGSKSYDITAVDGSVGLDSYQYVVLLCKPASITFGYAELK